MACRRASGLAIWVLRSIAGKDSAWMVVENAGLGNLREQFSGLRALRLANEKLPPRKPPIEPSPERVSCLSGSCDR